MQELITDFKGLVSSIESVADFVAAAKTTIAQVVIVGFAVEHYDLSWITEQVFELAAWPEEVIVLNFDSVKAVKFKTSLLLDFIIDFVISVDYFRLVLLGPK